MGLPRGGPHRQQAERSLWPGCEVDELSYGVWQQFSILPPVSSLPFLSQEGVSQTLTLKPFIALVVVMGRCPAAGGAQSWPHTSQCRLKTSWGAVL